MTNKDTITLPRELVEAAVEALMVATTPIPADRHKVVGAIEALRTHLAAEQPKPEPVMWQERYFYPDSGEWSRWYYCRPRMAYQPLEQQRSSIRYQWRPLYTTPPDADALRRDAESLESLYHPATEILIEGLKKIGTEDAKRVLSAWDNGREIFDNRFLSRRDKT